ncbi:MAG TPA: Gfo/Idh/MocA family oxidoreductase [Firmicutes bacterium]|nr:Gfo/Idh/MocA family oxidoreductase [Bacillota bacterium]
MKKIPVGVIGTGFIGPAHVEALRRTGLVDVVAIADIDQEVADRKAEQLGIEKAYGDWQKILADPDIEAVHICTPNNLHYPMSKAALEAGKHVVCEKPLAMNSKEAEDLVDVASRTGLVNAIHFNVRYYPLVHQARAMVEKGDIGKIFAIHGSYLQDWLFYETDYNWRLEPEYSGESRAVADIGSHWLDLIEFISGLRVKAVCADFATFHPIRKKPLKPVETYAGKMLSPEDYQDVPINTEDYATVLLEFEGGAKGVMTVNQVAAGRKNRIYFEIDGSKKALAWDSEKPNELWIGRRDGNNEVMIKDPSLMYPEAREIVSFPGGHTEGFPDTTKQMFKQVYSYIASGDYKRGIAPKFPTFKDGHREIMMCEVILKSARERKWVEVK